MQRAKWHLKKKKNDSDWSAEELKTEKNQIDFLKGPSYCLCDMPI